MSLFKTYVRHLLEYNSVIWNPTSSMYIDKCERVQRYFTKKITWFVESAIFNTSGSFKY